MCLVLLRNPGRAVGGKERQLGPRSESELAEHFREIGADVGNGDPEALGDLLVGEPFRDEPGDTCLAQAQPAQSCLHGHAAQPRPRR